MAGNLKMSVIGEPEVTLYYEMDGKTYQSRGELFKTIYAMRTLGLDVPPVTRHFTQVKTVKFE